jgi:hypothetical protein
MGMEGLEGNRVEVYDRVERRVIHAWTKEP